MKFWSECQTTAHPAYVLLYVGTCGGWIVLVLNLFTGEARRTPLMPRNEVPEKHSYLLWSIFYAYCQPGRKEGRKEDGMFCLWEWRFTLLSSPLIKFCQGDFLVVFYNQLGRNICKKYPCNHLQFTVFISSALKLSI